MKERKLPIFIFSLLFASLVWVSIQLANTFQTTIEIPVEIENLSANKAIASPIPSSVKMKIQTSGWQIVNFIFLPTLRYTIDFKALTNKDTVLTQHNIVEHVNFPNPVQVLETSPKIIVVRTDDKISKSVPIDADVQIQFRDGFGIIGKINSSPDSVILYGAKTVLSKIHSWKTEALILQDIFTPIQTSISLSDTLWHQISRSQTNVTVSFDVQSLAEKSFENIPIEITQVPENRNLVLIPNSVKIIVRSGVYTLAPIVKEDFSGFIDYKSILLDTSGFIEPTIVGPENIKIVQVQPEKIQYVIRK